MTENKEHIICSFFVGAFFALVAYLIGALIHWSWWEESFSCPITTIFVGFFCFSLGALSNKN